MSSDCESKPIIFKKKKIKSLRQRIKTESSDSEDDTAKISEKLVEMKDLQNLRKRQRGVDIIGLAIGEKLKDSDDIENEDILKLKTGGMIDLAGLKSGKIKTDDAYDTGIGTQFSVETNKRDEDEEMMKYIEEQLTSRVNDTQKRPTFAMPHSSSQKNSSHYLTPEEAALNAVPKHLRENSAKRSEEMLSNQMLSGIPEVDLGIEAKIKNIEATEEAKLRLLWEKHNKNDAPSQFVPTNMAVNFVQHNRFNIDYSENPKKQKLENEKQSEEIKTKNQNTKSKSGEKVERATDDYHYEKFRKQFRKF